MYFTRRGQRRGQHRAQRIPPFAGRRVDTHPPLPRNSPMSKTDHDVKVLNDLIETTIPLTIAA